MYTSVSGFVLDSDISDRNIQNPPKFEQYEMKSF